jgi:hypothetical protein
MHLQFQTRGVCCRKPDSSRNTPWYAFWLLYYYYYYYYCYYIPWSVFIVRQPIVGLHCRGFTITFRHTTLDKTPLDEWSVRSRDLYRTIHNTHKRQTSLPPAGFESTIPASERPQTHALVPAATGICHAMISPSKFSRFPIIVAILSHSIWLQKLTQRRWVTELSVTRELTLSYFSSTCILEFSDRISDRFDLSWIIFDRFPSP